MIKLCWRWLLEHKNNMYKSILNETFENTITRNASADKFGKMDTKGQTPVWQILRLSSFI